MTNVMHGQLDNAFPLLHLTNGRTQLLWVGTTDTLYKIINYQMKSLYWTSMESKIYDYILYSSSAPNM